MKAVVGVRSRRGALAALAALLLAFLLRLWVIQSRPLWYDEAFAVLFAQKGFNAMLYGTLTPAGGAAADVHPILYYTALNGWMSLAGSSPLAVRHISVLSGLATIALLYDGSRRLFGARAALVAAGLAALSPFHVYYSQEARMYAPLALWAVLAGWCVVRLAQDHGSPRPFVVGFAVAAALAVYMQSLAAFFLLVLAGVTLFRPALARRVVVGGLGAIVLYLPWLLQLPGQVAKVRQAYWLTRPTFLSALQTALIFHGGEELLEAARAWIAPALAVSILGPVLLVFSLWRGRRATLGRWAAALAVLAVGPPVLLFAASFVQPVYLQRALLPSALMYYAALAWASARTMPRPVAAVLLAAVAVVNVAGLAAHYRFEQFPRPDYAAASRYLAEHVQPGEVVVHSNKLTFLPMVYYAPGLRQSFVGDPPGSGSDTLALPTQQALGLFASPDVQSASGDAPVVWFVIFDRAIDEYRALFGQVTHPHLAWLEANYQLEAESHFGDLGVYEFAK